MKTRATHTTLFCLVLFLVLAIGNAISDLVDNGNPQLKNAKKTYTAGSEIVLTFSPPPEENVYLYYSSSYGSTIVYPTLKEGVLKFIIPEFLARTSGLVSWKLVSDDFITSGEFQIVPDSQNKIIIETYLGPQQVFAGGIDFAMMTAIPVDLFDNPLQDSTELLFNIQFEDKVMQFPLFSKNMIVWKRIFSTEQTGRILATVQRPTYFSKEKAIEVYPFVPQNFKIAADRNHTFADGNQITQLKTSIVKDKYGNIVADGTLVDFIITDKSGYRLKIPASTINGIATGNLLHPEAPDTLKIKAYIYGIAESESMMLTYQAAVKDFDVQLSSDNFEIEAGPIRGFMNQLVPDGLTVTLKCYYAKDLILTDQKTTVNGKVNWSLNPAYFPKGIDEIQITTAGIKKQFNLQDTQ